MAEAERRVAMHTRFHTTHCGAIQHSVKVEPPILYALVISRGTSYITSIMVAHKPYSNMDNKFSLNKVSSSVQVWVEYCGLYEKY